MTTPGPNGSHFESLHPAISSSLSPPPSSPAPLLHSQPKPPTPLPVRTTRSKSVPQISSSKTTTSATTTTTTTKPSYSKISSLYQYTWDRIDDLKIITGALCERLIALEDTVATLDEDDNMEIFTRKAFDMATEGQLIAMIAEQFKETGTKIADRGTDVGLEGGDYGQGDGNGIDIENGHGNGNGNGNGSGEGNMNGNGNGTQKNQGREKRRASVSDPDTDSDPDL